MLIVICSLLSNYRTTLCACSNINCETPQNIYVSDAFACCVCETLFFEEIELNFWQQGCTAASKNSTRIYHIKRTSIWAAEYIQKHILGLAI